MSQLQSEHKTDATNMTNDDIAAKLAAEYQHKSDIQSSNYLTETIELPSKGLLYPKDSVLSSGKIEMRYLTAKDEDILTSRNLINKGATILFDRLLKSIIVSNINLDDVVEGDKEQLLVAARVLSYGKDYSIKIADPDMPSNEMIINLDLTKDIPDKEIEDWSIYQNKNEFDFILPSSNVKVTFKLITHGISKKIDSEISAAKKLNSEVLPENVITLQNLIVAVNDDRNKSTINKFISEMRMLDSKALKKYMSSIMPGLNWKKSITSESTGIEHEIYVTPDIDFFWDGLRE